jgi:hypothetical protein
MRLARSVLNENGMVLLSEDTELTDTVLEKLKHMGVDGVCVKGMSKPEKSKKEMLLEIDERFRNVNEAPYMSLIKKVLQEHIEGLYEQA